MKTKIPTDPPSLKAFSQTKKEKKNQRLAQALRENLRKRKEQARLRKSFPLLIQKEKNDVHPKS